MDWMGGDLGVAHFDDFHPRVTFATPKKNHGEQKQGLENSVIHWVWVS